MTHKLTIEQILAPAIWECPSCKHHIVMENVTWCGKNLQCSGCKEYHYYNEHKILDPNNLNAHN